MDPWGIVKDTENQFLTCFRDATHIHRAFPERAARLCVPWFLRCYGLRCALWHWFSGRPPLYAEGEEGGERTSKLARSGVDRRHSVLFARQTSTFWA